MEVLAGEFGKPFRHSIAVFHGHLGALAADLNNKITRKTYYRTVAVRPWRRRATLSRGLVCIPSETDRSSSSAVLAPFRISIPVDLVLRRDFSLLSRGIDQKRAPIRGNCVRGRTFACPFPMHSRDYFAYSRLTGGFGFFIWKRPTLVERR